MTIQEALTLYKLPYIITDTINGGGFTSYRLTPAGSSATPERLKSKLNALKKATEADFDIIEDNTSLYIRENAKQVTYNYMDYAGYIDYNDPLIPFIVGFNNGMITLDSIDNARHILVAGTTGSGKSVFLHNLITTFCCNPNVYLYLVDCKAVEFNIYKDNALLTDSVFGEISAARFTVDMIENMNSRFQEMKAAGYNDYMDYKQNNPEARRHILVIDELSDMIADQEARRVIIPRILRIAQKGRAAGFHVILSTQRPDSSVINGTLKGNIPTRAAFRTISNIDSRIILDQSGAERLRGNGDMLYLRNGSFTTERIQAPYISLSDIARIA